MCDAHNMELETTAPSRTTTTTTTTTHHWETTTFMSPKLKKEIFEALMKNHVVHPC
jgi:hypothetical protein